MKVRPSRDEFRRLAAGYTVVPVRAELLADLETPVSAFAKLVGDGTGFLLESVEHGERWGRFSFVGWDPVLTISSRDGVVDVDGPEHVDVPRGDGVLAAIEALLAAYRAPELDDLPPLSGGLIGYLGYDVVREVERLPNVPPDDRGFPDAVMSMIGSLAAFDHWRQRVVLIESVPIHSTDAGELDTAYDAAVARVEAAAAALGRPLPYVPVTPPETDEALPDVTSSMPAGAYQKAVEVAKEYIVAGDIFQVVLAQRFDLDLGADPFDVYRVLRQVNPSPYMYFLRGAEVTVVGSSPEPMVKVVDGTVISRPIAGTRKRGSTDEHDRRLAAELAEHPKERAEHVMLVDLARNDVGRVARFGTVTVDELMTLERYSHVMHLTSQVSGTVVDGLGPIDVLRATLPAGTVSGAPKVRAMEIIDELEPVKRGPYAGVVGYVDWRGNLDTAIAIRTMFVHDGAASVQAGAGIVADSDPDDEDLECRNKAAALLAAVPAARRMRARALLAGNVPARAEQITLTPLDARDADRVELVAFLTGHEFPFHSTPRPGPDIVERWIAEGHFGGDADHAAYWIDTSEGRIGLAVLQELTDDAPLFDLRLATEHRGKGLGAAVLRALTDHVFATMPNVNRFEGLTREDNIAMRTTFLRAGFVKEAHYREGWPGTDGAHLASVAYSILRRDWRDGATTPVPWDDLPS